MSLNIKNIFLIGFVILLGIGDAIGQCGKSDFYSPDTIPFCAPNIAKFQVVNMPAGCTYEWNIGAGYAASSGNPTYFFDTEGTFTIKLRVTYPNNTTCIITKIGYITTSSPKIPKISIDTTLICSEGAESISIKDLTTKTKSRNYFFNGDYIKNAPNPFKITLNTINVEGAIPLFVEVIDSFGCLSKQLIDTFFNFYRRPVPKLKIGDRTGCKPLKTFAELSIGTLQTIDTVFWGFSGGVGSNYSKNKIDINYPDTGLFFLSSIIKTEEGCEYYDTFPNLFLVGRKEKFNPSTKQRSTCANQELEHGVISSSPSIKWAIRPQKYSQIDSGAGFVKIKYNDIGVYSLSLSGTHLGCTSDTFIKDFVVINGPLAAFNKSHKTSCAFPDTFKLWDNSKYPTNGVNSRKWNVYDESNVLVFSSTKDTFNLILPQDGARSIQFIASNSNGCSDTIFQENSVEIKPLQALITLPSSPACPNEKVYFSSGNDIGKPSIPNKYKWTFYDLNNSTVLTHCYSKDTNIIYKKEGSYGVKLVVYNSLGCKDSVSYFDTIEIASPFVKINVSDKIICAGESIDFSAFFDKKFKEFKSTWTFVNTHSSKSFFNYDSSFISYKFIEPGIYNLNYKLESKTSVCKASLDSIAAFSVQGRIVQIVDSGTGECNPGIVKLHAKSILLKGETNPSGTKRFWKGFNNENITNPSDSIIYVNIKDNKLHAFKYVFESSNGCKDSINHSVQLGINASFDFSNVRPCLFETITIIKYGTSVKPQSYKWYSDSSHKVDIIDEATNNPKFYLKSPGYIPITTIQTHSSGCSDTITKIIYLLDRKLEISSMDTVLNCAPQVATFNIFTNYANYLKLDFGDGSPSELVKVGKYSHLYKVNSGPPGFDIKLIGNSPFGCPDTLDLKGYMKVVGPVVDIDVIPSVGCETLKVLFLNNSKYFSSVKSSFGDGSALDSSDIGYHNYKVFAHPVQEVFKPFFIVSDGFCETPKYFPDDSVIVFKKPESHFEVNKKLGCSPLTVDFKNLSRYSNDYQWDFDGDGVIDSYDFRPRFVFKSPGFYRPILISRNFNNCFDTIAFQDSIDVLASPDASFIIPSDTFCAKDSFTFIENTKGRYKIVQWLWNFGDPNTTLDTSTIKNPKYAYTHPGNNIINLRVIDSVGCVDTTARRMHIHDTILPIHPEVSYVSVEGKDVYLQWDKFNINKFDRYAISEDFSGYKLLTYKYNISDSSYLIKSQEVDSGALCYSVSYFDSCNFQSKYDEAHCASFLSTYDSTGYNQVLLKWTKYVGWGFNDIYYYNIFRSIDGAEFKKIGQVVGNIQYYLDDSLCDNNHCYYVEAVHRNGKFKSKSNVSCSRVKIKLPNTSVRLKRATVLENQSVLVEWEKDTTLPILGGYVLGRNANSRYLSTFDTFIIDKEVEVDLKSYTYKMRVKDHCENYSIYSNVGKTILLSGKGGDFSANLEWTPYEKWESGIEKYILDLKNENGEFEKLMEFDENTVSYVDKEVHLDLEDSFCYRVTAIKRDNELDSSVSNTHCLAPNSVLFVPSGFTPNNGDNLNNIFIPFSAFLFDKEGDKLRSYEFTIYNRWGEQIFHTVNPKVGWDGTFGSKMAPLGTYLYSIKAVGLDGKAHQKNGYVALIR